MALFNKLFFSSNKRKNLSSSHSHEYLSQFPFDDGQVRILLYRECDTRGRRLLFDSSAIKKVSLADLQGEQTTMPKVNGVRFKDDNIGMQSSNGFIEISDGFAYKHSRPNSSDIASIGEMVFGALAMSFRGTALKVHWLESPARVLCSQVFLSPVHTSAFTNRKSSINLSVNQTTTSDLGSTDSSSLNSFSLPFSICVNENLNLIGDKSLTTPLDVPPSLDTMSTDNNSRLYSIYSGGDSGYCGPDTSISSCQYSTRSSLGSVYSDPESIRKLSVDSSSILGETSSSSISNKTSDGSFQRRISRNIYTSFENHNSMSDFIGFIGDNYQTATNGGSDSCVTRYKQNVDAGESRSNPEMIRKRGASSDIISNPNINIRHSGGKRAKLGLAVFITLTESFEKEMELFCSEHIALLESMLCRLRASAENAYINHKNFLQIMLHAWRTATRWITDLFTAPRLPYPVWLTLSSGLNKNLKNIADNFMSELCWLLSSADTKDTNFFISTMLTAVLTHHLGWVSTVAAFNSKPKSPISEIVHEQNAKLIEISRKHPYNALWAQMGDLYGAIGNPPKIARTIVYGSEKHTVDKVLNVLTYFIRCGEVRRVMKTEVFDKDLVNRIFSENNLKNEQHNETPSKLGLTRTKTCTKSLEDIAHVEEANVNKNDYNENFIPNLEKHVMNDIPNVLAFRDSHFVQQELRIGNFLMDTGIEMGPKQKMELRNYQLKDKIRLTVTSPENVEITIPDSLTTSSDIIDETGAVEAIEIEPNTLPPKIVDKKLDNHNKTNNFFWTMEPVKEGLSWEDIEKLQRGVAKINKATDELLKYNTTSIEKQMKNVQFIKESIIKNGKSSWNSGLKSTKSHTSLSDLITANSVGQSERFTWGIERVKENVSLEEEQHFELSKKIVEKERSNNMRPASEVVFVLGDNEALVNIKKSNEDLHKLSDDNISSISSIGNTNRSLKGQSCCNHKKHSGVKFNFEQYPQIATNYMKNKNLDLSNYDFLEKSSKLEEIFSCGPSTSTFPVGLSKINSEEECEYCAGAGSRILQTPSNATELEFSSDDNYPTIATPSTSTKNSNFLPKIETIIEEKKSDSTETLSDIKNVAPLTNNRNSNKEIADIKLIEIPLPNSKIATPKDKENQIKPGFIPSLLIGISDHYIPDMVLQGTNASPKLWEMNLKQDLALSAHCATLIPSPTENVAIVADLDKWDVKVVSSQTHILPYGNATSGPVGMSQLVSSMLETVQAMCNSGISAYECLSYLESRLQEMYLQSEALAAFLLATEFCSLNTVTSALNLSANDVPLLLSVASIHSPQVTKKYGVSSR